MKSKPKKCLVSSSVHPPLFLRSSSVPKSVQSRCKVGGGGEFHRVWYGGRAKDEQTMKYSKSSFNVNLEKIKISRNQEKYSIVWDFMFEKCGMTGYWYLTFLSNLPSLSFMVIHLLYNFFSRISSHE